MLNIKKVRYYPVSLGCVKNQSDLEYFMGEAEILGWQATSDLHKADVVIVNTCAFINDAREESLEMIFELSSEKKVIVTGCLPQRYSEDLRDSMPEISIFAGTEFAAFVKDIDNAFRNDQSVMKITGAGKKYRENVSRKPISRFHTYIKISEGCSRKCSFCAIPSIRGNYRSRAMPDIVAEVRNLYKRGFREFNLISEDISLYGTDIYKKRELLKLMKELDSLPFDDIRFRLLYMYPENIVYDAADFISESRHFLRYIDMPVQHISAKVLKSMGRQKFDYKKLFKHLSNKGIVIRTTLMTGFPSEGRAEFREMEEFVSKGYIDKLGVFAYSPEEGTSAYGMKSPLRKTAIARMEKIMLIQDEIAYEKMLEKKGTVQKAVLYSSDESYSYGRLIEDLYETDNELWCEPVQQKMLFRELDVKIVKIDGPVYMGQLKY